MMYKVLEVNVDDTGYGGVFSLVKGVIARKKDNEFIDIAAIEKFEKENNIKELKKYKSNVYYIGYHGNKILKQFICLKNLIKLIKKNKYECVHIHADVSNKLLVSGIAAKLAGVNKIILHSHAAGVDGNNRKIKLFFHYICRRILKQIGDEYVACSELAAEWMFPNIKRKEIIIIKNGVDLNKFRFNKEDRIRVRNQLGIKNEYIVGHVGRFAYQKNHTYLIDIFAELCKRRNDVKLLLVGEGILEQEIKKKVEILKLRDKVIFYGTTDEIEKIFSSIDVFILPSHFEGLPIVGVEAQASGLPVVFSSMITREAAVLKNVEYIDITEQKVLNWCNVIEQFISLPRLDSYAEMKAAGFSMEDTQKNFYKLYEMPDK